MGGKTKNIKREGKEKENNWDAGILLTCWTWSTITNGCSKTTYYYCFALSNCLPTCSVTLFILHKYKNIYTFIFFYREKDDADGVAPEKRPASRSMVVQQRFDCISCDSLNLQWMDPTSYLTAKNPYWLTYFFSSSSNLLSLKYIFFVSNSNFYR